MSAALKRKQQKPIMKEQAKKVKINEEKVFPLDYLPNDVILHILKFLSSTDIVRY